jgi:hypothetical protein
MLNPSDHLSTLAGTRRLILSLSTCCGLLASCLLITGCGSPPKVSNSGISGDVRTIENWKVVWVDSVAVTHANPLKGDPDFESKQRKLLSQCATFVQEVRGKLQRQHGFQFVDNKPIDGVINIRLFPRQASPMVARDTVGERISHAQLQQSVGNQGNASSETGPVVAVAAYGIYSMLFGGKFVANKVDVGIDASSGKSLGNFVIGNGARDRVTASDVADMINRLISTGTTRTTSTFRFRE